MSTFFGFVLENNWWELGEVNNIKVNSSHGKGGGRSRAGSWEPQGFFWCFGLRFPKSQWVQIRATYIMLITFIESNGDRVEGV